jgi:fructosamine-3-kinase
MLRALGGTGVPVPRVEGEHENILLLEYVPNDSIFNMPAWADVGRTLRASTTSRRELRLACRLSDRNGRARQSRNEGLAAFWGEQRLVPTARLLTVPGANGSSGWLVEWLSCFPSRPSRRSSTVIFGAAIFSFRRGALAALIDPACYHGHGEVDLAMLTLFGEPPQPFWDSYGRLEPGWEDRRPVYQLFPALVHLRLFGANYSSMVDRC